MIRVAYSRQALWLRVEGHAESGPYGRDLVCAAVSALILTLGEAFRSLEAEEKLEDLGQDLDRGRAYLRCKPLDPFRPEAETALTTVIRGLRCLEKLYPGFLSCREVLPTSQTGPEPR